MPLGAMKMWLHVINDASASEREANVCVQGTLHWIQLRIRQSEGSGLQWSYSAILLQAFRQVDCDH